MAERHTYCRHLCLAFLVRCHFYPAFLICRSSFFVSRCLFLVCLFSFSVSNSPFFVSFSGYLFVVRRFSSAIFRFSFSVSRTSFFRFPFSKRSKVAHAHWIRCSCVWNDRARVGMFLPVDEICRDPGEIFLVVAAIQTYSID